MEGIRHRMVSVNGIQMHIAEKGEGPVVLFLHGFPEIWYSWRHQIVGLSSLGYHAVAPDLRGYGDSEAPADISSYSCLHIVGDLIELIDSIGAEKVFLVATDWGAMIGWYLCLFRPDRVKAFVCLSVPFRPRNPKIKPVEAMKAFFGEDYYMCRFQEPGTMEAEIAKLGAAQVIKKIVTDRAQGPPCLQKENAFGTEPDSSIPLPFWFTEADLTYNANKFDQRGFTGGLNYYRALDLNWELTAAWTSAQVKVPVKFIVGDLDMVYTTPGVKEYIASGLFKRDVPLLDEVVVMEGVGHFINQERAEEINTHIYEYIREF
ncbi:epoxide hydrolase A [Tripterygium wilfordii]|uniref:epoxide hydrolase A n=1 Tax=Tripterygium wilfordii TaxID=458696 RepID=UPI0018F81C5A|nr:epoxide hydrolase A [Tripterygium wilfordii]